MEEILGTKQTLWSLLNRYKAIEIPIIQRDYAQGRESAAEIRKGILGHILGAIEDERNKELDFIYGIRQPMDENDDEKVAFVPIDGQQRLTTLWLIHWYLAHKSGLLADEEHAQKLRKFTYETRPSAKMFIDCLCKENIPSALPIREAIVDDASWFDESWKLDSSVMGFIKMLEDIENHPIIARNNPSDLLTRLKENDYISFYFLPLHKFGLGEEIYSRMNARGKILTDFEKFKSTFFKIIDKSKHRNEIANKIEYEWVKHLWSYRPEGTYITDKPFMRWLRYVTRMLYVENFGNPSEDKIEEFASIDVLEKIYSDEENLKFLIFSLDNIPVLESLPIDFSFEWNKNTGFKESLNWIAKKYDNTDVMKQLTLWAALLFLKEKGGNQSGIADFLRVVRNLIENTKDNAMRQWPTMIQSIREMISDDVYAVLRTSRLQLKGFRTEQREIEKFKADMIGQINGCKALIQSMDDHRGLKGRLANIIIECQEPEATDRLNLKLKNISPSTVDIARLGKIFNAYSDLYSFGGSRDFNGVWGDLLDSALYDYDENSCWFDQRSDDNYSDYAIHPVILKLAREIAENKGNTLETILKKEKDFVKKMVNTFDGHLEEVSNPKEQLFLLYIITTRLLEMSWKDFFVCDRFNFSWVAAQSGYSTPFNMVGTLRKQIFQTINNYLKGDYVIDYRTPKVMKAKTRGKNILERLVQWANN